MMYKKDAFLLNECFVLFAFVCSLNGYEGLGILMGLAAIFYADFSISFHVLKNDVPIIITISLFELIMIEVSGLSHVFASLYFLSLSSLLVSFSKMLWNAMDACYGNSLLSLFICIQFSSIYILTDTFDHCRCISSIKFSLLFNIFTSQTNDFS
jgi:hypothetical protein